MTSKIRESHGLRRILIILRRFQVVNRQPKEIMVWIRDPENNWKSYIKHGGEWFTGGWRAILPRVIASSHIHFSVFLFYIKSISILNGESLRRMFSRFQVSSDLLRNVIVIVLSRFSVADEKLQKIVLVFLQF